MGLLAGMAGCAAASESLRIPDIQDRGFRAYEYSSLDELAQRASAIAVVEPTGRTHEVPLPEGYGLPDSAPIVFDIVRVVSVVSGELSGDTIEVATPGIDENTGFSALETGGPYAVFLTPAMYGAQDPIGGYAIVGGPAGFFAATQKNTRTRFQRVDTQSPDLPKILDHTDRAALPTITKTEAELLAEGP
ncbi:hypothetical protein D9V32_00010 [Mycetocola tolaasinivorans]|uniref:Uncharacterized protein n=1 Tax=Mycetocola tolaasinivorans TaxID=76635 RepID=A0A3L7AB89_9MICO|nr:hypothetical protein D9V32_00010 [Mycetocola tolaasinivorans]